MKNKSCIAALLLFCSWFALADEFAGRVVGVHDGGATDIIGHLITQTFRDYRPVVLRREPHPASATIAAELVMRAGSYTLMTAATT